MVTVNDIREQSKKRRERQEREDAIEEKALGLLPDELLPDGVSCHSAWGDAVITFKVKTRQDAFDVFKKFDGFNGSGLEIVELFRCKDGCFTSFGPKGGVDKKKNPDKIEMLPIAPIIWHGRVWGHGGKSTDITFCVKIEDMTLEVKCETSQDGFSGYCTQEIRERRTRGDWIISGVPGGAYLTNYAGSSGYDAGYTPGQIVVAWPYGCDDLEETLGVQ